MGEDDDSRVAIVQMLWYEREEMVCRRYAGSRADWWRRKKERSPLVLWNWGILTSRKLPFLIITRQVSITRFCSRLMS